MGIWPVALCRRLKEIWARFGAGFCLFYFNCCSCYNSIQIEKQTQAANKCFLSSAILTLVIFTSTFFFEIKLNTTVYRQVTYKSQHLKDSAELVSWKVNDLNVCTLLDSSQIIFLHGAVGNVIIKSTQKWWILLNSIWMCTDVHVWLPFFFFFTKALCTSEK